MGFLLNIFKALCFRSSSQNPSRKNNYSSSIETDEPFEGIVCEICAEAKETSDLIKNNTCDHSYCYNCMTRHVAMKIQNNITVVPCPGLNCKTVYEKEACWWIPEDLLEKWDKALCEALFLQVPKFYCPYNDCSVMMVVENEQDDQYAGETKCPACRRMFCPKCKVPWHPRVKCEEYQKLNKRKREDLRMTRLAEERKWKRCPKCKFYVERSSGCHHIACRCKYHFCYLCGYGTCRCKRR